MTMFNKTHGATCGGKWTRTYYAWKNMKSRCLNPNRPDYKYYGGRGICICERWINSFLEFRSDMGDCPEELTLDRIDHNGNYEPSNCRWITQAEQKANTRRNVVLTFNGKTLHLSAWAREINLSEKALWHRYKQGWSTERILTKPLGRWAE